MAKTLKCHKCKKLIKEDEKAFRCSDCETYPFHEGCLDENGYCAECAKEREVEEEESADWELIVGINGDESTYYDYTKKVAIASFNKIKRSIETGKPTTLQIDSNDENSLVVVAHISSVRIRD